MLPLIIQHTVNIGAGTSQLHLGIRERAFDVAHILQRNRNPAILAFNQPGHMVDDAPGGTQGDAWQLAKQRFPTMPGRAGAGRHFQTEGMALRDHKVFRQWRHIVTACSGEPSGMPVGLYAPVRQGGHGNPDFRSAPGIDRRGAIFEYHTSCRDHVGMGHARAVRPLPGNAQRSINLICPAHTRDRTAGNGIQMGKEVPGGNILQKADIDTTVRPGHGAPGSGGITPRDFFKNRNLLHRRELRAAPVRWHAHPKNAGLNQILDHVGRKLPSPLNLIRSGTECVT